jgi:hypothetical protein
MAALPWLLVCCQCRRSWKLRPLTRACPHRSCQAILPANPAGIYLQPAVARPWHAPGRRT